MAKFGMGGAKVDLVLDQSDFSVGDEVRGQLVIQGGNVEQKINQIDILLYLSIYKKGQEYTKLIETIPIIGAFVIGAGERKVLPFSYVLPNNLLLSTSEISYYFVTHLDIAEAIDHKDRDHITIHPPRLLQNVLTAFGQLGFVEKHDSREFNGYVQEFELAPTSLFRGTIEEVEFVVSLEGNGIRLFLEVDLYSFTGEKEIFREVWLDQSLLEDVEQLRNYFEQILNEIVQDPRSYFYLQPYGGKAKYAALAAGAVGGIAAGLIAAEIIDEIGDLLEDDDDDDDDDGGFDFDFFGDDDDD
jgi:sporulation-control protein